MRAAARERHIRRRGGERPAHARASVRLRVEGRVDRAGAYAHLALRAGSLQQLRQAQAAHLQLAVAASEPGAIFRFALAVRHRSAAAARADGERVRRDLRVGREPGERHDPLPRVHHDDIAVGDAERHPARVADERIDDRTERGPVRGERIAAAAAARLDRDLERRLREVDRHQTYVAGEQGQQRNADRQRVDPAFENTGDADSGVTCFD